ncbi:hypothetical protein AB0395_21845 [Streptosporangium sp. NPDC051023]|uniref:hypothetical protein n=1 Tax=Streptosporangium sp. NPDC051023 TaxID=3155410 RepID=UPI003450D5B6
MTTPPRPTDDEIRVSDHVIITDANINFGQLVGCPATVVDIDDDGYLWVILDAGQPARREVRVGDQWIPMRFSVESARLDGNPGTLLFLEYQVRKRLGAAANS